MPVLSPHRSSASGLSGSYRPTYSSALDRPYYSSGYSPRVKTFSERYTARSYTDADGRRVFSRSGSITEDGVTTRFREESREGSSSRDSITSRDYRDNSLDYPRRDSSSSRDRLSSLNVIDSVAELRNKYSPANYVPACKRNNDNISRSKSINDIGLPPIEAKSSTTKKKVNSDTGHLYNGVLSTNITNDNTELEDDNGNRASVADLRKKFTDENSQNSLRRIANENSPRKSQSPPIEIDGTAIKISENRFKKLDSGGTICRNGTNKKLGATKKLNGSIPKKSDLLPDLADSKCVKSDSLSNSNSEVARDEVQNDLDSTQNNYSRSSSRVNNFASYIPTRDYKNDENSLENGTSTILNGTNNSDHDLDVDKNMQNNDISISSPKLNHRSTVSPSSSGNSSSVNNLSRRSLEKSTNNHLNYSDDEDNVSEKNYITNSKRVVGSPVKTLGLNGLKNIGNTCFMNSVIQCLSNTKLLMEYLKKDSYVRDINTNISSMRGALIKAFAEVIKELWSEDSSDRVVNTVSLKSQIQRFAPRFMGYAQQDAQEFLRYLLEGLHEDVNRVTEKPKPILTEIDEKLSDNEKAAESWSRYLRMDNSHILDLFVGQLKSTLKCTHCGHCSVTFDPFWDLSLSLPQRTGQLRLSQCLESFTREETLDGDEKPTCAKCKERRKCTKSFTIQKFPKILVIHLKRFSPTERFRGKLSVTVDFPLDGLDMSSYAAESVAPCRYNLYAISNHSGTTYSGHYTAYCKHPYNHTWHEYNDSRVSSISPRSIISGEAYVLFYEQEGQKSHL